MSEPLVEVVRAGVVEALHRGDLAVVDSTGSLLASVGDPVGKITYWRSAAKPFQALPLIFSGAAARWRFSEGDLALVAGSHNGERVHVDQAAALLAKIGCNLADLACGAHLPLEPEAATELLQTGEEPSVLHNNCSGKHIGMLALAEHFGADRVGYQFRDHPVQAVILESICAFSGVPNDVVAIGIDGCGVPCFGTSVYHLAWAFARLMDPRGVSGAYSGAAHVIQAAMTAHPYLVAGRGRLDTDLMQVGGDLIAKGGASGVHCVGLSGGVGLAIKIEDGSTGPPPAPGGVATIAALRQLRMLDDAQVQSLDAHANPLLRSVDGQIVGEVRASFNLSSN
ncbi:MAG: asparaginase [Nocardioidaceae bacterium]|nr:asparaginase [Nocardioidaceae bacterium]